MKAPFPEELTTLDCKRVIAIADTSRGALANYFRGIARERTRREVERALRQLNLEHLIRRPADEELAS